jgi:hypothetical protein
MRQTPVCRRLATDLFDVVLHRRGADASAQVGEVDVLLEVVMVMKELDPELCIAHEILDILLAREPRCIVEKRVERTDLRTGVVSVVARGQDYVR